MSTINVIVALSIAALGLMDCGREPVRTESTSTDRVEQSEHGEVHRTTTETRELAHDGTVTVERTETTETTPVEADED